MIFEQEKPIFSRSCNINSILYLIITIEFIVIFVNKRIFFFLAHTSVRTVFTCARSTAECMVPEPQQSYLLLGGIMKGACKLYYVQVTCGGRLVAVGTWRVVRHVAYNNTTKTYFLL